MGHGKQARANLAPNGPAGLSSAAAAKIRSFRMQAHNQMTFPQSLFASPRLPALHMGGLSASSQRSAVAAEANPPPPFQPPFPALFSSTLFASIPSRR